MHHHIKTIPTGHASQVSIPAVAAAAATIRYPIFRAPFNCRVKRVAVVPQGAVTGAGDRRNLNIQDEGDGADNTEIANLDLATGTNLAAHIITDIDANLDNVMVKDEVLSLESEKVASGVAVPELLVIVEFDADHSA